MDLEKSGKDYTTEDVANILFEEMEEVMQKEFEKRKDKLPKVKPPNEPKTQEEKCAVGRHGRIVECDDGDMCSAFGRIAYYYLK